MKSNQENDALVIGINNYLFRSITLINLNFGVIHFFGLKFTERVILCTKVQIFVLKTTNAIKLFTYNILVYKQECIQNMRTVKLKSKLGTLQL